MIPIEQRFIVYTHFVLKKKREELPIWLFNIFFNMPKLTCQITPWLFNQSMIYIIYFFSDVSNDNYEKVKDGIV